MRSTPTRLAIALLLAGLVAAAAGCGATKKTSVKIQTTTTVPTQPATTSGGAGAVPSFASAKNCQDMAGIAAKVASALESSSGNGAKTLQTEESELQALANAAPPAIKSDFQTFATTFQSFRGAIQKSGYNLGSKTPPTPAQAAALAKAAKSFDGTKLKQAEQHLSAWARQNCHGVHVGG